MALYLFDEGKGRRIADRSGRTSRLDLEIPPVVRIVRIADREFLSTRDGGGTLDRVVNVILFVPLGFLIDRASGNRRRPFRGGGLVLLTGAGFTFGMESVQYFLMPRSSSLIDLVLNLVGVGVGLGLSRLLERPDAIQAASQAGQPDL